MSENSSSIQYLLDELLWDIYGKVSARNLEKKIDRNEGPPILHTDSNSWKYSEALLWQQNIHALIEISAALRLEIRIIGTYLTRVLMVRDHHWRKQQELCDLICAYLKAFSQPSADAQNMRFSLSPPHHSTTSGDSTSKSGESTSSSSDFDQWLHAMKMVARLPGGMPPEFRRKLWLALSEKYLQTRNVDWEKEETKCFSEQWREDDEELGIQIVKDLHRTGSSLCSGPAGSLNQAKLKRVLLGYARWNPEVGYCQGFNMLGALILQVMDKNEVEAMKVMIFLVEGVLPSGYFSGSLGGLQADMAVFRDIMTLKLPKLAKHLQRLQGRNGEDSFEPPLTNVFTMQWFLTLFCTCLPITCVLRVWDLVLIEGSDVLLRTAIAIWSILEDKILCAKTADDFYCKMGMYSGELLNGHLLDSNGLIEKVVELGPVPELQKLREKHLYNIAPWRDKKGIRLYYSDDEGDSDDDSRLAVTTAWGIRINRRGSVGPLSTTKPTTDNKDRLALDISLLKKQYDRLRERQRQAHIILTAAVARQAVNPTPSSSLQMNQLLIGRNAIVTNKGRRIGPPQGAIPPARKIAGPAKPNLVPTRQSKRGETLHWRDTEAAKRRRSSTKWKEPDAVILAGTSQEDCGHESSISSSSLPSRSRRKSESSSYSEDSNSSTSTSLCDEEDNENLDTTCSSLEASPLRRIKSPEIEVPEKHDELESISKYVENLEEFPIDSGNEKDLDSTTIGQIPVIQLTDSVNLSTSNELSTARGCKTNELAVDEDSSTECDRFSTTVVFQQPPEFTEQSMTKPEKELPTTKNSDSFSASMRASLASSGENTLDHLDVFQTPLTITSTSQLSPIADISKYLSSSSISPLRTPTSFFGYTNLLVSEAEEEPGKLDISEEGVTNEYFERINIVERPSHLELIYSLNDDKDMEYSSRSRTTTPSKISPFSDSKDEQTAQVMEVSEEPSQNIPSSYTDTSIVSPIRNTIVEHDIPHEEIEEHPIQRDVESIKISECRASSSIGSIFSHSISKEKSFSFDVSSAVEKQELRPTSCPEARASIVEGKAQSERVLKIIEENSIILHRILGKGVPQSSPTDNKESLVAERSPSEVTDDIFKTSESSTNIETEKTPSEDNYTTSQCVLEFNVKDYVKTPVQEDEVPNDSRPSSRILDLCNIELRSDDNIADRLASIKNTIKSIDSLCEEKDSFNKSKCQRYIDSLFKDSKESVSRYSMSPPNITINSNVCIKSPDRTLDTNDDMFSSSDRFTRTFKREISPRRRRDEDREEYESRVRRDKIPKYPEYRDDTKLQKYDTFSMVDSDFNNAKNLYSFENKYESFNKNIPELITDNPDTKDLNFSPNRDIRESLFDIDTTPTVYVPAKIELRHTTVTSTFYDRYLSQKRERNARAEKSPPSLVITRAYLDTLKPTSPLATRNSKSAENSPSREKDNNPSAFQTNSQRNSYIQQDDDLHVQSCDNILLKLRSSAISSSTYSSLILKSQTSSDVEVQLGLYKSSDYDSQKS